VVSERAQRLLSSFHFISSQRNDIFFLLAFRLLIYSIVGASFAAVLSEFVIFTIVSVPIADLRPLFTPQDASETFSPRVLAHHFAGDRPSHTSMPLLESPAGAEKHDLWVRLRQWPYHLATKH
jgi:hypothetical protein